MSLRSVFRTPSPARRCPRCDHSIATAEANYCDQCGERLCQAETCVQCGNKLLTGAAFCSHCGQTIAPANEALSTNLYCKASGSAILPGEAHFVCQSCHAPFLERFRFENQPRCEACAAPEVPAAEAETPKPVTPASTPEPVTTPPQLGERASADSPRDDEIEDYYHGRLVKLGVSESDWIEIPAGEYIMGSPPGERDRFPNERQHPVNVKRLYMLKTPVTFDMYDLYCDELKLHRPADEGWGRERHPVINITYWDTLDYCIWLQKKTGWKIRLPTEAEWEFACRAGTTTPFWTGESISSEQANYDANFTYGDGERGVRRGKTTPVDEFPANPWGLHDMHGNVWEWCASLYDEQYAGAELEDASYDRDNLMERVVRGGSWYNVPGGLRSASRNKMSPNLHYLRIGFRLVREED